MSSMTSELPKDYHPVRSWRLWIVVFAGVVAFVDIFVQFQLELGVLFSATSAVLGIVFAFEVFLQLKRRKSLIGLAYAHWLAIAYLVADLLIYFVY